MGIGDNRRQGLEVDIDLRLVAIWQGLLEDEGLRAAFEADDLLRTIVGTHLRLAYGRGYSDALEEDAAGKRGELPRTHGYRIP